MAATTVTSKAAKKAHTINAGKITRKLHFPLEKSPATVPVDGEVE
jgi:hypothetical protein